MKLLFILILFVPIIALSQAESSKWDYPVKPGSEKWKTLKNEEQRFLSMQVPSEVVKNISTEELIKTCINLPAFGFYNAFDNYQMGFLVLAAKFNGIQELSIRNDAFQNLIKIYEKAGENGFSPNIYGIDTDFWTIRLGWIEILLSQKIFLKQGKPQEIRDLTKVCLEKYDMKLQSKNFSKSGAEPTLFLMVRILETVNNKAYKNECIINPDLKEFENSSQMLNSDVSELILRLSQQFIND